MTTSSYNAELIQSGRVVDSPPDAAGNTHLVTVASKSPGKIDLVLEGGGVKGLGLVGAVLTLDAAKYKFQRIAGASAGAIVATLLAALNAKNRPVTDLEGLLSTIDYSAFAPRDLPNRLISDVRLLAHEGLHNGKYLETWLGGHLDKLGVTTFGDLRIVDPDLPLERCYSLVVTVSDVTRGKSIRLPWDYLSYGLVADEQRLVDAVRASMSMPFFFTPVHLHAHAAEVGGVKFPAETCTWVDGGMLDNFPVDVFDRTDKSPGRWPTIGVKLSASGPPPAHPTANALEEALACLSTLVGNADRFYVGPIDAQRTIFVDHGEVQTTDFAITSADQQMLLSNGHAAAAAFLNQLQ